MNLTKFKPLLAVAVEDVTKINYPVIASVKVDGIRAIVKDSVVYSRSMKPIPSRAVQEKFGKPEYEGFDGELVYGSIFDHDVFTKSTSFCMSHEVPEGLNVEQLGFLVFDIIMDLPYKERLGYLVKQDVINFENGLCVLRNTVVNTAEELIHFEECCLAEGAEGIMVRDPNGRYKQGRSTLKEGILLKVKRFVDEEAEIIGFEEKMHNENEATLNELGHTERSTSKEGLVPAGTLGSLVVHSEKWGEFKIGTGFDDALRKEIWENKDSYKGKLCKFKYFPVSNYEKPRFPVYLAIRSELDL